MGYFLVVHVIGVICAFSSLVSSDELLVVGETGILEVSPILEVKVSVKETSLLCERIHIQGMARFQHLDKYAHSIKLTVNASTTGTTSDIHVCYHRNLSRPIGICPHYRWEKVYNGSWVNTISPFDHKILDVYTSSKVILQVFTVEEWSIFRIVFLIIGAILLSLASKLSTSVVFYYISAFTVGHILAVLLLLCQILRSLPTGRNAKTLYIYSSVIGLVGVIVRYTPSLFQSWLRVVEFDKGIDHPTAVGLALPLYMLGVSNAYFAIIVFALTPDGTIDIGTASFMSWSIWILAALLILQSSVDLLLAGGGLISVIVMSSILKRITKLIFPP